MKGSRQWAVGSGERAKGKDRDAAFGPPPALPTRREGVIQPRDIIQPVNSSYFISLFIIINSINLFNPINFLHYSPNLLLPR
jgi:hypothetical protein